MSVTRYSRRCSVSRGAALTLVAFLAVGGASVNAGGGADIRVDVGTYSDPGRGDWLSFGIFNDGPDPATNVIFRVNTPPETTLRSIDVDTPCRLTIPGSYRAGEIVCEIERIDPGLSVIVDVYVNLPNIQDWSSSTTGTATADQPDPDSSNNSLVLSVSVPIPPAVTNIRTLENPFRLEITGSRLNLVPFGSVIVGCYDEYLTTVVLNSDDRLILGGGKELRRRLPRGRTVPITISTPSNGVLTVPFTRP